MPESAGSSTSIDHAPFARNIVNTEKKEIPVEVQVLCNTFRGTIIAGA